MKEIIIDLLKIAFGILLFVLFLWLLDILFVNGLDWVGLIGIVLILFCLFDNTRCYTTGEEDAKKRNPFIK